MRNKEVERARRRLDALFARVSTLSGDAELQSHWARYLCVLASGFIESSVREILSEYTKTKSHPRVLSYVEQQLRRFQNPNMEAILQLVGAFDPEWRSELDEATEGEVAAAVNSIVTNRHGIAHGRTIGLSYVIMHQYYLSSIKLLELVDSKCNGS